ncbi:methyl-accepting chemotaxis protein [Chloroflexota bacterium]
MDDVVQSEQQRSHDRLHRRFSLRLTVIVLLSAFAVVPLLVTLLVVIPSVNTRARNQAEDQVAAQAETRASAVNALVTNQKDLLQTILTDERYYADIRILLLSGQLAVASSTRMRDRLDTLLAAQEGLDEYFLYDLAGNVLLSTNPDREGLNIAAEPYFTPDLSNTRVVVAHEDAGDGDHADENLNGIFFMQPVASDVDAVEAILVGRMPGSVIEALMQQRVGLGRTGESYIVLPGEQHLLTATQQIQSAADLHTPHTSTGIARALGGISGVGTYDNYHGDAVLGAYQPIPELDNAALLVEFGRDEMLGLVQVFINIMLTVTVLVMVIAVPAGVYFANWITRPINRLTNAARRFSGGDLTERVEVNRQNELGELGDAFNQMADNLQESWDEQAATRQTLEDAVTRYVSFAQQVASGDLTARLSLAQSTGQDDEQSDLYRLGWTLNGMAASLGEMARQVWATSQEVSSGATEILAATSQQIASATEQDEIVNQTAATVEEVRITVDQTADRSRAVAAASRQSVDVSRRGEEAVTDAMYGMETLRGQVDDIAQTILLLSDRTQQIEEIISSVNDITDQSKLLALNASIEAARAGEQGRGFAVVAMEVRQLAEQSQEATARIGDILHEIQQTTNTAVMVTEEGTKGADSGMALVNLAGATIRDLAETIESAAQAAEQIASSTHQQANGIAQLANAMESIRQATGQTAASSRQSESSARSLHETARQLEETATQYRL